MSNPIGMSSYYGPPEGLSYCGEHLTGGVQNYVGSGGYLPEGGYVEAVGGPQGVFYLPPTAIEPIEALGGGPVLPCADTPTQCRGIITHNLYDYGAVPMFPQARFTPTGSGTTDAAATAVAGATCEFVTVGVGIRVNLFPGYIKCTTIMALDAYYLESFTVAMGGVALDWIGPTARPLPDLEANHTPPVWDLITLVNGGTWFMLRPTALTWPGQDPDNQWNRAMWHPSEIGTLSWHIAAWAWSWGVSFPTVAYGYQRATNYPTPCPIVPPVRTKPPKVATHLSAGPSTGGQVRGKRNLGGTAQRKLSSQERYTIANLVYLAVSVGLTGDAAATAGAIAMAESGGDPQNIGYNPGPPASRDRGLWQINDYYHPDVSDQCAFDPTCNAHAMYDISGGGTNWTPWATYNNGLHLPFMAAAEAAVSAMTDVPSVADSATSGASGTASAGPLRHDAS